MNTVLLTWNPGPHDDLIYTQEEWLDTMVVPYLDGNTVNGSWSVANHVNSIEPGDTAFLFRQGECGRGIVARGTIQSYPWEGLHWDPVKAGAGKTTNYVDVEWLEGVPVDLAIEVEELEMLIPDFAWRKVYSSGRVMPGRQGKRVSRAWPQYVNSDYVQAYAKLYVSDVWRNVLEFEL